ncbi:MAG TPA: DNA polymerase III subunit delta' [Gemmataceae bacterium]|nr:DNA polymerase III subunit delta' [Gemmataceae bacterium]
MSWQHIRGHEFWVRSFADAARRGRLAHAYLFAGSAGIGKKLFALELAKALLCTANDENVTTTARFLPSPPLRGRGDGGEGAREAVLGGRSSPSPQPSPPEAGGEDLLSACDQCPSCWQVAAGTHPDVIFASRPEDKVEFPIDTMREVMEKLALKPARGGYKVAIIDDADDFNLESANCFLKTLEEPPPKSLLILIATDPERQLPTVLSRCQVIHFRPVPVAEVTAFLREQGIEPGRAERLAKISGGSPGQALELAEGDLWNFRKEFIAELARTRPDSVRLAKKWMAFTEEAGTESGAQRRRAALLLKLIMEFLEDVLRASLGVEIPDVDLEDRPAVEALARRLGPDRVVKLLDRCLDANYHIDRRVQLVLIIESLVDALTNVA